MKKRIISALVAFTLILSALVLSSCSEAEPLPEGVSELPDLDASTLTESLADESGVIQWPAELLPEGFPVPKYEEIYSVEREDNIIRIILFGKKAKTTDDSVSFMQALLRKGYSPYDDVITNTRTYYNKDGVGVRIAQSGSWTGVHLEAINEKSPTGFTYEITVLPAERQEECLFWEFPDANTDLGLEPKTFDEWPAEYLPEDFPRPGDKIEILEMEQKSNGLFITVKGNIDDIAEYQKEIAAKMGFLSTVQPLRNANGDYIFYEPVGTPSGVPGVPETWRFQICPPNDLIIKDVG